VLNENYRHIVNVLLNSGIVGEAASKKFVDKPASVRIAFCVFPHKKPPLFPLDWSNLYLI
jgi:hypothetical protein